MEKLLPISIYFGDAQDNLYQEACLALEGISPHDLVKHPFFAGIKTVDAMSRLVFLRQVHGVHGESIDFNGRPINSFEIEGDFLTTNQPGVGLGVLTADCVPIVFYDPINHAVAIAHAGWRGTVGGIAVSALERMKKNYKTDARTVQIFFGPSAQTCCYEVGTDFMGNVTRADLWDQVIIQRENRLFFDVSKYNRLLLGEAGVPAVAFNQSWVRCTICTVPFFSHRRQGALAGRQATLITLK
jgi:YfiH family protein